MKKLLLILLCVPLIGLGQEIDSQILQPLNTVEEMPLFGDCTDEECTTNEILKFIESYDFELWLLERGFIDPKTKQILQADVVFCKK